MGNTEDKSLSRWSEQNNRKDTKDDCHRAGYLACQIDYQYNDSQECSNHSVYGAHILLHTPIPYRYNNEFLLFGECVESLQAIF